MTPPSFWDDSRTVKELALDERLNNLPELLHAFLVRMEKGSYGEAATELKGNREDYNSVSRQIKTLAAQLGIEAKDLFVDDGKSGKAHPATELAVWLQPRAQQLLDDLEQILHIPKRSVSGEIGELRVGFVGGSIAAGLPEVVRSYLSKYPEIELHLFELSTQKQTDQLIKGQLDVGFLRGPKPDDRLGSELFLNEPWMLAVPPTHQLINREAVTMAELAEQTEQKWVLVTREENPGWRNEIEALLSTHGIYPRSVQQATMLFTMLALVAVGVGICPLPASAEAILPQQRVKFLRLLPESYTGLYVAWRKPKATVPKLVSNFIEICREVQQKA